MINLLFVGIVSDLFPKVHEKTIDYDMFVTAIRQTIADMGLANVKGTVHSQSGISFNHRVQIITPTATSHVRLPPHIKRARASATDRFYPQQSSIFFSGHRKLLSVRRKRQSAICYVTFIEITIIFSAIPSSNVAIFIEKVKR